MVDSSLIKPDDSSHYKPREGEGEKEQLRGKTKEDRGVPLPLLQRASNEVQEGKSVRAVAKSHDICHVTLYRFHKKRLRLESQGSKSPQRVGYWTPKKVFSTEQEMLLRDYLMETT
ncbi:hypothetical protein NQZ68_020041 [Dissostichus eleginoides]|nr:hypothetical protein NQZ68_020041 [Dissostichus eleginoides]